MQDIAPDRNHSGLEEISLNAWPALRTFYYDGWLLRFANGYTRRANCVLPLYRSRVDPATKIRYCETVYAEQGQRVVFKLTDGRQDAALDAVLEACGYQREAPTGVQVLALGSIPKRQLAAELCSERPTAAWIDAFIRLNNVPERHRTTMETMLASILPQHCFMSLTQDGEIVATGLAVVERGYVGLFDIVTAPHMRRQGIGTHLIEQLLEWGRANGAKTAYLQVMHTNEAALRLYAALGFRDAYSYWYRVQPPD